MKVLIVEDEIIAQENLTYLLKNNFPNIEIIGTTQSAEETITWLSDPDNQPDVIFMDIELSDTDCFEIFKNVDINASVIMTTAYDAYAIRAFEAGSIDYLLKPIQVEDLNRAINRYKQLTGFNDIEKILEAYKTKKKEYKNKLILNLDERIIMLPVSDISYIYTEYRNTYIVTIENVKVTINKTIDSFTNELDPHSFFRISRDCIVSLNSIASVYKRSSNKYEIITKPAAEFKMLVSRYRKDAFLEWLNE